MDKDKKIKELESKVRELTDALRIDPLTGVLNRKGVEEELEDLFQEVQYAKGHPEIRRKIFIDDIALIFIDLDDFKMLNDASGHLAGDSVLQKVASLLQGNIRGIDSVGRLGGEEFVVVLVGANELEGRKKAEELRSLVSECRIDDYPQVKVTASFGVASVKDSNADSAKVLLKRADEAMYEAKKNKGKNSVVALSEMSNQVN